MDVLEMYARSHCERMYRRCLHRKTEIDTTEIINNAKSETAELTPQNPRRQYRSHEVRDNKFRKTAVFASGGVGIFEPLRQVILAYANIASILAYIMDIDIGGGGGLLEDIWRD